MMHVINKHVPKEAIVAIHTLQGIVNDPTLVACLYGSAVVGGLRPHSDVDVLVIMQHSLSHDERKELVTKLMETSGRVGQPFSARPLEMTIVRSVDIKPWRYPPKSEFVYGEWLRQDYKQGYVPMPVHDPDLAIVLRKAGENNVPLIGPDIKEILDPVPMADVKRAIVESLPALTANIKGDERNVILTLARMWLTVATGKISSKDMAAEWAIMQLPGRQAAVVDFARREYLGACTHDWKLEEAAINELITYVRASIEAYLGDRYG